MARVADQLYEVMEAVIENPELMLDSEYAVFPTDKFPVLSASLEAKQSRTRQSLDKKSDVEVWPLIVSALYDKDHAEGETYDKISCRYIKVHAEGCIASMEHNCKNWLTKFDGKFCVAKWTDDMEADLRGAYRTNIKLGESLFSQVDSSHGIHTGGSVRGPSGNPLHGGL
jgi:hypothetical protein